MFDALKGRGLRVIVHPASPLRFVYTNHRGLRETRRVKDCLIFWGSSEYYPEPQWLMSAYCLDRDGVREFAVAKMEPMPDEPE